MALLLLVIAIRVDWPEFLVVDHQFCIDDGAVVESETVVTSTVLCVLLGVPMALGLAHCAERLVRLLRLLICYLGVAHPWLMALRCSITFGRLGLIGRYLEGAVVSITFSTTAVVMARTLRFVVAS